MLRNCPSAFDRRLMAGHCADSRRIQLFSIANVHGRAQSTRRVIERLLKSVPRFGSARRLFMAATSRILVGSRSRRELINYLRAVDRTLSLESRLQLALELIPNASVSALRDELLR